MIRLLALIAMVLGSTAASAANPVITLGMGPAEVRAVLGDPSELKTAKDGSRQWLYRTGYAQGPIDFVCASTNYTYCAVNFDKAYRVTYQYRIQGKLLDLLADWPPID